MTETVTIFEMSPRDGLQNEKTQIETARKVELINLLTKAGLPKIECASFVNPKAVPQMADGADVLGQIERDAQTVYSALTPNLRGFEAALAAGVGEVAIFVSASEGFSRANINCSIEESLLRYAPVARAAREAGLPVRGYVSCVADCPYDGPVAPAAVAALTTRLLELGVYEVSLGDTIGSGTPERITRMLEAVLTEAPPARLAGHYHDTGGHALGNIRASLALGLRVFDASAGGLGGCPFAPGAAGNVATEAVAAMLHESGFETGIDTARLSRAADYAKALRRMP